MTRTPRTRKHIQYSIAISLRQFKNSINVKNPIAVSLRYVSFCVYKRIKWIPIVPNFFNKKLVLLLIVVSAFCFFPMYSLGANTVNTTFSNFVSIAIPKNFDNYAEAIQVLIDASNPLMTLSLALAGLFALIAFGVMLWKKLAEAKTLRILDFMPIAIPIILFIFYSPTVKIVYYLETKISSVGVALPADLIQNYNTKILELKKKEIENTKKNQEEKNKKLTEKMQTRPSSDNEDDGYIVEGFKTALIEIFSSILGLIVSFIYMAFEIFRLFMVAMFLLIYPLVIALSILPVFKDVIKFWLTSLVKYALWGVFGGLIQSVYMVFVSNNRLVGDPIFTLIVSIVYIYAFLQIPSLASSIFDGSTSGGNASNYLQGNIQKMQKIAGKI